MRNRDIIGNETRVGFLLGALWLKIPEWSLDPLVYYVGPVFL